MSDDESDNYIINEIIHCSKYPGGYATDYIIPDGIINYPLKKGVGTGIYGLSKVFLDDKGGDNPEYEHGCELISLKMDLPYIINTIEECKKFLQANRYLENSFQNLAVKHRYGHTIISEDKFITITKEFINIIGEDFSPDNVQSALMEFWHDYNNRQNYVEMPINYILKKEGNDGIMSHPLVQECHNLTRGDVKFIPYPTKQNITQIPIRYIIGKSMKIDLINYFS